MKYEYECPTNAFECPYFKAGICTLSDDFEEIAKECDDFAWMVDWLEGE